MRVGQVRVGTCGWSYDHWAGIFYPDHLPSAQRLEFYASRFDTVEIDGTFYRLPSEQVVASWRDAVPDSFVFAVKGSRLITHFHRLTGVDDALATFLGRMSVLGEKLAVVLWQLPPNLRVDTALLAGFLERLPASRVRHAVEFRHGTYSDAALEPWARFLRDQADEGRDCFAYFNNDAEGHAPADAGRLIDTLGTGMGHTEGERGSS